MPEINKIKVLTESEQTIDAVVTSMKADVIWILLGEGDSSIKCKLEPTRNGLAYAGSIMGREIIYPCSVKKVQEQLAAAAPSQATYRWKR